MVKKGVLLLQMGGPKSIEGIENFLFNLFNDPFIIQLPWFMKAFQKTLASLISSRRAPKVAVNYKDIGGYSPICFETMCQARALEFSLNKKLFDEKIKNNPELKNYSNYLLKAKKHLESKKKYINSYFAMRYSAPFLKDIIPVMERDGIEDLTVIPLYPQYSDATTGSSIFECKDLFTKTKFSKGKSIKYIESWEANDNFILLIQSRIKTSLNELYKNYYEKQELDSSFKKLRKKDILILFSAHGLPKKYVINGDPYQDQIEKSVSLIMEDDDIAEYRHMLSFQSRVGPVKWLEPNTEDVLIELAEKGEKNIIIIPISFVGDHVETMHEINIEYREIAEEKGIENFIMTRAPKAHPLLIKALEDCFYKVNSNVLPLSLQQD